MPNIINHLAAKTVSVFEGAHDKMLEHSVGFLVKGKECNRFAVGLPVKGEEFHI